MTPEGNCGYGEFLNSSRSFSGNNIGIKGSLACGARNIGMVRFSEITPSKASVILFYSLSTFYDNTCEVIYYFSFLFQVHLKELNTKLPALTCLIHVTIIRDRNIITI